ncbi:very large low complexity protein [Cystoisospora suis]|uniref:Very large low complexity protein n=1 Tax=Cystoisospora suis TaxID=483139 RepID=A0A2C6KHD7_9APIC|nr:very large low complexity protein [Cystoisospora suis]
MKEEEDGYEGVPILRRRGRYKCTCNVLKYASAVELRLLKDVSSLAPIIECDTGTDTGRHVGEAKSVALCGSSTLLTFFFYVLLQHNSHVLAALALPGSKAFDFYQKSIRRFFLNVMVKQQERKALERKQESEEKEEKKETAIGEGNAEEGKEEKEEEKKKQEEEEEKENEELVSILKEKEEKEKEQQDSDGYPMSGDAYDLLMFLLISLKHRDRDFQFLAANVSSLLCLQPVHPQLLRDFSSLTLQGEDARRPRKEKEEEAVEMRGGEEGQQDGSEEGSASKRKNRSALSSTREGGGEEERRGPDKEGKGKGKDVPRPAVERMADKPVVYQLHRLIEGYKCYMRHPSWKVRSAIVRLSELLGCQYRMLLSGSPTYRLLVDICILGLQDQQPEVQQSAKAALSYLLLSCTDEEYRHYTEVFLEIAGPVPSSSSSSSSSQRQLRRKEEEGEEEDEEEKKKRRVNPIAGVLGLSALVHAVPFDVPPWLPHAITSLAKYASTRMPDNVRRHVEKTLQEFYRTHQDAWQQLHVHKFSPEQLDVLETYKGRPTYFA